jgi:D-3-phosphoglycerate dehydrogenase
VGLIGDDQLHQVKPGVIIVNAARGGIVDEVALASALADGRVAAAGVDVYAKEPCTDSPLFGFEQVVATPHLGASTDEAQEKAGIAVARSVRLALAGELVPDAVNVKGGAIADDVRPMLPLTEALGQIACALAKAPVAAVETEVRGELTEHDVKVLELSALKGLFTPLSEEQVSYVNAPIIARDRGIEAALVTDADAGDHRNLVRVRLALSDGTALTVGGTLSGPRGDVAKLVEIDDFDLEVPLSEHLVVLRYADRPGIVGTVGGALGDAGVNIGGMQVSRDTVGGQAVMVLTVDASPGAEVLERIAQEIAADQVVGVDLV